MRALIIDDHAHVRENLRLLFNEVAPDFELVGEADGMNSGEQAIKTLQPDLVFLDIEMADGTGFDLLNRFKEPDFRLIFVTGHDGYAIRAFRVSAIDYLLKPVDPDDLEEAIEKVRKQPPLQKMQIQEAEEIQHAEKLQQLVLSDSENIYLVQVSDILRCQSEDNYTRFFLRDGRKLLISKTLKEYAELLEPACFFRSHQSHLINLSFFDHYDKRDGGTIRMKDGATLPLATRKKDQLIQVLRSL